MTKSTPDATPPSAPSTFTAAVQEDADERILNAAGKLFREKGFAATTVREIASAANMLPGSLHYRYASKDDVLLALMNRAVKRAMSAVRAAIGDVKDPVEKVRLALRAHLELLCNGDDSLYVLLFDWRSLPAGAREGVERERGRYESFWDGMLYEAHGSGRARPILDIELVRHFGFGAINWVATWYRPGGDRTPGQIADTFFAYLAYGLIHEPSRPKDLDTHFAAVMAASLKGQG